MLSDIGRLLVWCVSLTILGSLVLFIKLNNQEKHPILSVHKKISASQDSWNLNEHNVDHKEEFHKDNRLFAYRRLSRSYGTSLEEDDQFGLPIPQLKDGHVLGIIVPFRDRFDELLTFIPYMNDYLKSKHIEHKIFIVNQIDKYRFNRASLINIGFSVARNASCDYIAMHDVDLLPKNQHLNYSYPGDNPFHVSGPSIHPKYHYPTFVGGILLFSMSTFEKLNGMSNSFWGWGREDDELFLRIRDAGLKVKRHGNEITTGFDTFYHDHDPAKRKRDYPKKGQKSYRKIPRDKMTGLSNVQYTIESKKHITIDGSSATIINVFLECNTITTPYCLK